VPPPQKKPLSSSVSAKGCGTPELLLKAKGDIQTVKSIIQFKHYNKFFVKFGILQMILILPK
jgi:hypothetical protein